MGFVIEMKAMKAVAYRSTGAFALWAFLSLWAGVVVVELSLLVCSWDSAHEWGDSRCSQLLV